MGGGTSGNTLNSAVSSTKDGTQVVLALPLGQHEGYSHYWSAWLPDNRDREIWNRRVGFLVWRVRFINIEEMHVWGLLGRGTRRVHFQGYPVAVRDETK